MASVCIFVKIAKKEHRKIAHAVIVVVSRRPFLTGLSACVSLRPFVNNQVLPELAVYAFIHSHGPFALSNFEPSKIDQKLTPTAAAAVLTESDCRPTNS